MMNRLMNWFRRRDLERDLNRELKYHFDRRVSDLILSGLPEPEARRQAMLEFGGITRVGEEVRDVWLTRWLRDFVYDLHFSARSFLRSPSFTATAVLSLALGIGATTVREESEQAYFPIVNGVSSAGNFYVRSGLMIALPTGTQIWIAAGVTDLRRGFTGLSRSMPRRLNPDNTPRNHLHS